MKELDEKSYRTRWSIKIHLKGQEIAEPINELNECSIKTEKVLKEWKRADIMPIYKNGNKEEPPVSLTSIVCKICEVIKKQWTDYLEREGIISDR